MMKSLFSSLLSLKNTILYLIEQETLNQSVWNAISMIIGISCFFQGMKIHILLLISLIILNLFLMLCAVKFSTTSFILSLCLFALIGQGACYYREYSVDTKFLQENVSNIWLAGDIERIDEIKQVKRLYLTKIEGVYEKAPDVLQKIRVRTTSKQALKVGMRVAIKCNLMPPPEPSFPEGFDMRRFFYFKQINAVGYGISKPFIVRDNIIIDSQMSLIRQNIISKIHCYIAEKNAAIASGLLVGDASSIDEKDFEAMRIAGTAHLIAISGMHIVVIAGIVFFLFKFLLIRWHFVSQRWNIKKIAATFTIAFIYWYLILVGELVSAERAFYMSALFFASIIFDKEVDAKKSLAVTVMFILLLKPENVISPSLQMSVAACLGLIAGCKASFYKKLSRLFTGSIAKKMLFYLVTVVYSTIIAGLSAAIFISYHFKQFSLYSVIANLVAVPLTDFFIMPCGLIALALIPLGFEKIPFILMDYGITALISISHYVSALPNASIYIPFFSDIILLQLVVGLILLCICHNTKARYLGVLCFCIAIVQLFYQKAPEILVSSSGEMFAINSHNILYVPSKSKERYVQNIWKQTVGAKIIQKLHEEEQCNRDFCRYDIGDFKIIILRDMDLFDKACEYPVDLLINMTSSNNKCNNSLMQLNKLDFIRYGGHAIWCLDNLLMIKRVNGSNIFLKK